MIPSLRLLSLILMLPPLFYKDPCEYIGLTRIIPPSQELHLNPSISNNLIIFAKPLLHCKEIYSQVLGIRIWISLGEGHYSTYNNPFFFLKVSCPSHMHWPHSKVPKMLNVNSNPQSFLSLISSKVSISSPMLYKWGVDEALGMVHPGEQFLSICGLMILAKNLSIPSGTDPTR